MAIMIVLTTISYNPSMSVVVLHDTILTDVHRAWVLKHKWLLPYLFATRGITMGVSTVGQLLYVWACSHSFGILDNNEHPSYFRFYSPSILILTICKTNRLVLGALGSGPTEHPGSTFVILLSNFKILEIWQTKQYLQVAVLASIELITMIAIIHRMFTTTRVLREAHCVEHRGERIGFRYFLMHNIILGSLLLTLPF